MRRLMLTLCLIAAATASVGVLLPGAALSAADGGDLPFKLTASGHSIDNLLTLHGHGVYSGMVSQFGLSTSEQDYELVPIGPNTIDWSGTWSLTAANGDEMFGTATGTDSIAADGIHSTSLGTYTSTGGTGRFADASLRFEATAQGTLTSLVGTIATIHWEVTAVGTLSRGD
jgi:hypothetical protein